jgi:hypothetical protein
VAGPRTGSMAMVFAATIANRWKDRIRSSLV